MLWRQLDSLSFCLLFAVHLYLMSKTSEFPIDVLEIQFHFGNDHFLVKSWFLSCLKFFGIHKMKLHFQNIVWEFRSFRSIVAEIRNIFSVILDSVECFSHSIYLHIGTVALLCFATYIALCHFLIFYVEKRWQLMEPSKVISFPVHCGLMVGKNRVFNYCHRRYAIRK